MPPLTRAHDPALATTSATPLPTPTASLMTRCGAIVGNELADAERELAALLRSSIAVIPNVTGHVAFAGGKRLRPLLTLLCAKAAGFVGPERITIAAVGELLHTATLLHDDVIDEGEFRRGRPAARMEYGNGLAVLSGDYCFARGVQAVAETGALPAIRSLAETVTRMAEGEVAQLHGAGDGEVGFEEYSAVIERKTATLISWCSAVGDLVAPRYRDALRIFGVRLGYAFQIADDVLDIVPQIDAQAGETGKTSGRDLREGKMTLPLILACEADPALLADVLKALRAGPPMEDAVADEILDRVGRTDAIARAQAVAMRYADEAAAALKDLPPSPAKDVLLEIPGFVVRRSH